MDLIKARHKYRIDRIKSIANHISSNYFERNELDLNKITYKEEISVIYDHYENCFDGLLSYDRGYFYIHLNMDKGNFQQSKRGRFSLSHELGHYFIPEHYQSFLTSPSKISLSKYELIRDEVIEEEADCFAANLLMPSAIFKSTCYKERFSFELMQKLSESFNVSLLSIILRFADSDAGTYPIMVSFFRNHFFSGFKQSDDFPLKDVPFKTKIGNPPPPTSVLGEYYKYSVESKFKDVQKLTADDWFHVRSAKLMYEQCFYSDYGYDISVIWFD